MEIMPHQLELAVDGVIDAHHILANVFRSRDGRDVLRAVGLIRMRKGVRIQLEHGILVNQACWNPGSAVRILWKGSSLQGRGNVVSGGVLGNKRRTTRPRVAGRNSVVQ